MGIDWNPGPKPRPGCETEFLELWSELHAPACRERRQKIERFGDITITSFETLQTPRVGYDSRADEWAREAYGRRVDKSLSLQQFLTEMRGSWVLDLVPPCDGLPRYSNGSPGGCVEAYSFRAQFLADCMDIIGDDLFTEAYGSELPDKTHQYGEALLDRARQYAATEQIALDTLSLADDDRDSLEFRVDVVISAGEWCQFWGRRGHWLESYC